MPASLKTNTCFLCRVHLGSFTSEKKESFVQRKTGAKKEKTTSMISCRNVIFEIQFTLTTLEKKSSTIQIRCKWTKNQCYANLLQMSLCWFPAHCLLWFYEPLKKNSIFSTPLWSDLFTIVGLIMKICSVNLAPATCFKDKILLVNATIQMNHFSSAIACLYYLLKIFAF